MRERERERERERGGGGGGGEDMLAFQRFDFIYPNPGLDFDALGIF